MEEMEGIWDWKIEKSEVFIFRSLSSFLKIYDYVVVSTEAFIRFSSMKEEISYLEKMFAFFLSSHLRLTSIELLDGKKNFNLNIHILHIFTEALNGADEKNGEAEQWTATSRFSGKTKEEWVVKKIIDNL